MLAANGLCKLEELPQAPWLGHFFSESENLGQLHLTDHVGPFNHLARV